MLAFCLRTAVFLLFIYVQFRVFIKMQRISPTLTFYSAISPFPQHLRIISTSKVLFLLLCSSLFPSLSPSLSSVSHPFPFSFFICFYHIHPFLNCLLSLSLSLYYSPFSLFWYSLPLSFCRSVSNPPALGGFCINCRKDFSSILG